jgi:hypothetical protein
MALRIKKQYKQPDGTVIEIEGTLDEIAQYEKNLNKTQKKEDVFKKKKELLKDEIRRLVQDELEKHPQQSLHFHYQYQWPTIPLNYPTVCSFCGAYGCTKTHIMYSNSDSSLLLDPSQISNTTNFVSSFSGNTLKS